MTRFMRNLALPFLVSLAMTAGSAGPAWGQQPARESGPQAAQPAGPPLYTIQPDDILEIFVWKEPDLSRKVLVRPDGRISLPLVQDLPAAGSTPGELRGRIEARLAEYIESPNVTVIVDSILHYKVYVTGKVQNPGGFTVPRPINVLQALTLAGGFQEFADKSGITVVQAIELPEGQVDYVVRRFNYGEVIKGKDITQNILLRPGDVVVVP